MEPECVYFFLVYFCIIDVSDAVFSWALPYKTKKCDGPSMY